MHTRKNLIFKAQNRAAVLIMTMMAICLTFMMIYCLTQTSGIGLSTTSAFYEREMALQAAQSGMDYAITQLQLNKAWRGDSNAKYWDSGSSEATYRKISSDSGVQVVESYGNVIGLMESRSGQKAAFRIKFNYEDSSDDVKKKTPCSRFAAGGAEEPKPAISIDMPYVSINNLNNKTEALAYRANTNGKGIAENTHNLELAGHDEMIRSYANHVPPERICLIVEGLAGRGLRDCQEPEDVNAALNDGKAVLHRYVEAYFSFNASPVLSGYAAYAKGTIDATVADKMFVKSVGYQSSIYPIPASGSLRADEKININGILNTYEGKLYSKVTPIFKQDTTEYEFRRFSGFGFRIFDNKTKIVFKAPPFEQITDGSTVEDALESNVATASASDGSLKSGLYQWHVTEDTKNKPDRDKHFELRYYPDDSGASKDDAGRPCPSAENKYKYQIIVSQLSSNAADNYVEITHDNGEKVKHEKVTMTTGASAGKVGFCTNHEGKIVKPILYLRGKLHCGGALTISTDASEVKGTCPVVDIGQYTPKDAAGHEMHDQTEEGVLQAEGNITLLSSVKGNGALVAKESDVFMVGESVLNSGSDGLAVYAQNVNLGSLSLAMDTAPEGGALDANVNVNDVSGGETIGDGSKLLSDISYKKVWEEVIKPSLNSEGTNVETAAIQENGKKFFENRNVRVEIACANKFPPDDPYHRRGYSFDFKFKKSDGNGNASDGQMYTLEVYENWHDQQGQVIRFKEEAGSYLEGDLIAPADSVIDPSLLPSPSPTPDDDVIDDSVEETGTSKTEDVKDYAKKFDNLCYGDQVINGVIYAKQSVNAELGGKYKLIVKGAIRAESGNIDLDCSAVDLTYDENCLAKLLPQYGTMSCVMWNCW